MQKILAVLFWLMLSLMLHLQFVTTQSLPFVACPEYFQYLREGDKLFGKITIPNLPLGNVKIEVQISQRESIDSKVYGSLGLYESLLTTDRNLINGDPISYRLTFPFANVAPKITRIAINGNQICSASHYPAPNTYVNFSHTFTPSTTVGRPRKPPKTNTYTPPVQNTINTRPSNVMSNPFLRPVMNKPATNTNIASRPAAQPAITDRFKHNPFLSDSRPAAPPPPPRPSVIPVAPAPSPPPPPPPAPKPATISQNVNEICGRENSPISTFIYGGKELARGQYPWLTVIYESRTSLLQVICGGSLVSARAVVSAAHCFRHRYTLTENDVVVSLGRHNLEDFSEPGFVTKNIQSLLIHPEYNSSIVPDADIAVLHMRGSVEFTNYIAPICLWTGSSHLSVIDGTNGFVAGWGGDEGGLEVSPRPKVARAKVVSDETCLRSSPSYNRLLTERSFCAGNRDNTGPCMGDSGGGLMISRGNRWALRGIVSAGQTKQQQCDLHEYVVFCDVAKHMTWLQNNM